MRAKQSESIHFQQGGCRTKSPEPLEELPSALGEAHNPDALLPKYLVAMGCRMNL
jgi:hypothetical protein